MTAEVTYADLRFTTLGKSQDQELQTARAKGSGDVGGHFSPRQTLTLENTSLSDTQRRMSPAKKHHGFLDPFGLKSSKKLEGEKRQEIKKNGRVKDVENLFRFEMIDVIKVVGCSYVKIIMFQLDIKCQLLEVSEVICLRDLAFQLYSFKSD